MSSWHAGCGVNKRNAGANLLTATHWGWNMKAAVLHRYDEKLTSPSFVSYEDVADPKIKKATDVIVRIGGAGVCRTDLHIVEGIWRDKAEVNLPYIMGHENAGWVEEVGSAQVRIAFLIIREQAIGLDYETEFAVRGVGLVN